MFRAATVLLIGSLAASPALAGKQSRHFTATLPEAMELFGQMSAGVKLGVGVTELTPELRAHFGAPVDLGLLVSQVSKGSAAEAAGVEVGDVLLRFGDSEIADGMQLRHVVQQYAGQTTELEVLRSGKTKKLTATLDSRGEGPRSRSFVFEGDGPLLRIEDTEIDGLYQRIEDLERKVEELVERLESTPR